MDACVPNKDLHAEEARKEGGDVFCGNAQHLLDGKRCLGLLVNLCLFFNVAYAPCSSVVSSIAVMSCGCVYVFFYV